MEYTRHRLLGMVPRLYQQIVKYPLLARFQAHVLLHFLDYRCIHKQFVHLFFMIKSLHKSFQAVHVLDYPLLKSHNRIYQTQFLQAQGAYLNHGYHRYDP